MDGAALPFPDNRIPADRISPQARTLINMLPLPNAGAPGAINNNFTSQDSDKYDADQFDIRVDHYLSDSLPILLPVQLCRFSPCRARRVRAGRRRPRIVGSAVLRAGSGAQSELRLGIQLSCSRPRC